MRSLHITASLVGSLVVKESRSTFDQIGFALGNLGGVHIVLLSLLGQWQLAPSASSATFALKAAEWFRRGRLMILLSQWQYFCLKEQHCHPLSTCPNFRDPLSHVQ